MQIRKEIKLKTIKLKNQLCEIEILKDQVQIDRGKAFIYREATVFDNDFVTVQGAKYLGFFSSSSLKTREIYISFAQLVFLSLYIYLREVCLLFNFE